MLNPPTKTQGHDAARDEQEPLSLRDAARLTSRAVRTTVRSDIPGSRRGIALLVVLVLVAIVSALSVQFTYNARANIWMSGNLAASTQAHYHARSGMKIALLAVNAKKNFPQMQQFLSLMGKSAAKRLEIWQRACEFVQIFATGKAEFFGMTLLDFSKEEAVGGRMTKSQAKEGGAPFTCKVTSEDARVNLNRAAITTLRSGTGVGASRTVNVRANASNIQRQKAQLWVQLGGLLRPMVETGHFASEEEVLDVVLNIIDWTDADDSRSDIDPQGNFTESSGAEGGDYGQYGYSAKNAKMDTVGEVQLVEGMTSDVYCKIRDKLTVFATDKVNVNDADLGILKGIICQAIEDEALQVQLCLQPGLGGLAPIDETLLAMESCRQLKKQVYSTPFTSMTRFHKFFREFPAAMGTGVTLPIKTSVVNQQLGVRTKMVRIETEGIFGDTKRKMVAVVDTQSGQLVHFHYE